jgi:hypothetical protein
MRVLLFAMGVLALVSAGLKFRGRIRNQIGTSQLVLAELGLGVVAVLAASSGALGSGGLVTLAVVTIVSIVAASAHQGRLAAEHQRRRELSEGRRLQRFIEAQPADLGQAVDRSDQNDLPHTGPGEHP